METKEIIELAESEIQRCIRHYNNSCNPSTRYKWQHRQDLFENIIAAVRSWDELQNYKNLDQKYTKRYGTSLAKTLER